MTFDELEKAITLTGNLERDIESQSSFVFQAGMGAVRAASTVDDLEYELSCVEARLQETIRAAATAAGEKVTEKLIDARILSHVDYRKLHSEYRAAVVKSSEWKALVKAFDARSHSLYNLTELSKRGAGDPSTGITDYKQAREAAARSRANNGTRTRIAPR